MKTVFVKPAEGRSPRHEHPPHNPIRAEGEAVPATPYYMRQMNKFGDTVKASRPAEPKAAKQAPAQAEKDTKTQAQAASVAGGAATSKKED